MGWAYRIGRWFGRFTFFCTMRVGMIRPQMAQRAGGYLIAMNHLSHLDPFLLSVLVERPIDWMARVEFYRYRPIAWILRAVYAFPVRRSGVPVSAIRTALARLSAGRIVGICPEGGVAQGAAACIRGGPIKKGVCLLSYRTGLPVLPVVMLGTDQLNRVAPWLPAKRARIWVAFGDRVIEPRSDLDRRKARQLMGEQLQEEFARLFDELLVTFSLDPGSVP